MAKKFKNISDMMKHMDGLVKTTSNKMADKAQDILTEHIMEDVYEYYDDIRSGQEVLEPYQRTWGLLDAPKVKRGRGKAFVYLDYDEEIIGYIRDGSTDWMNSILARLDDTSRKRDFFDNAVKEINETMDKYTMDYFNSLGFMIRKK